MVIDGRIIAAEITERLRMLPKSDKFLAGVLVGNDPASQSFQKIKKDAAARLGVDYRIYELSGTLNNDGLRDAVGKIAAHKTCGGVVVQLPLPAHINQYAVVNAIPPEKDPDVLSERSLGAFYNGRGKVMHPAAATVAEILQRISFNLKGKKIAVVGRGFLVGKPAALWFLNQRKCILEVLGSDADLSLIVSADLVVAGVGKAGLIMPDMLKSGACVIDFGYDGGKGDFDPQGASAADKKISYTPTPGGVGPILVAKLFENFYMLNGAR